MPSKKSAINKEEALAEKYVLLDSLLCKLATTQAKESALLAMPEVCTDNIINLYHYSLFAGQQEVIKTYLTVRVKFFILGLIHYLHSYIKGQLTRKDKLPSRQLQTRINLNYRPLSRLSMDLKVMPIPYKEHKFILCIIDEVINYLKTMPIQQSRPEEIDDALIENAISKYCLPDYFIMDQDSAFILTLMNYLFKKLETKVKTVAPYAHQCLQVEHGIKSLSNILYKSLD